MGYIALCKLCISCSQIKNRFKQRVNFYSFFPSGIFDESGKSILFCVCM